MVTTSMAAPRYTPAIIVSALPSTQHHRYPLQTPPATFGAIYGKPGERCGPASDAAMVVMRVISSELGTLYRRGGVVTFFQNFRLRKCLEVSGQPWIARATVTPSPALHGHTLRPALCDPEPPADGQTVRPPHKSKRRALWAASMSRAVETAQDVTRSAPWHKLGRNDGRHALQNTKLARRPALRPDEAAWGDVARPFCEDDLDPPAASASPHVTSVQ